VIRLVKNIFFVLLVSACAHSNAAVTCGVTSSPVAFGNVGLFSGSTMTATGEIRLRCEVVGAAPVGDQVSVDIKISPGNSGSYANRQLFTSGGVTSGYKIDYNLYLQSWSGTVWGDGATDGTALVNVPITGLSSNGIVREVARTVYGRIPAITTGKKSGTYSDSLVLIISF
jgi:spore coat protein U-like protein